MEIVKKNLIAFICGAIALLAIIAWFWPVGSMYSSFQEKLDERKTLHDSIKSLLDPAVHRPPLQPGPTSCPGRERGSPTRRRSRRRRRRPPSSSRRPTRRWRRRCTINRQGHDLLEPGSLPQPSRNMGYHFRYPVQRGDGPRRQARARPRPARPWPLNLPDEVLNSTTLATPEDIKTALDKKWKDEYEQKIYNANGQDVNRKEIEAAVRRRTPRPSPATSTPPGPKNFKIYMDPDALVRRRPGPVGHAVGQRHLVRADDAVGRAGRLPGDPRHEQALDHGVAESPVKNLTEVSLAPDIRMYVTAQDITPPATAGPAAGRPVAALLRQEPDRPGVQLALRRGAFPRGRRARRPPGSPVPGAAPLRPVHHRAEHADADRGHAGGRGPGLHLRDAPCVQVSLDCESLFMRDWTAPRWSPRTNPTPGMGPMPKDVQDRLGIPAPAPACRDRTAPAGPGPSRWGSEGGDDVRTGTR